MPPAPLDRFTIHIHAMKFPGRIAQKPPDSPPAPASEIEDTLHTRKIYSEIIHPLPH
jgi:hypothetical protein